eukprot:403356662
MNQSIQEEDLDNVIKLLEEHQKTCVKEQRYVGMQSFEKKALHIYEQQKLIDLFIEAEMARNRINELKLKQSTNRWDELMKRQEEEKQEVEQAHILEYQQFNRAWDEQTLQQQEDHQRQMDELENKHTKELEDNRVKLENELSTIPKASSELLNMKKIQEQLGLQGDYKGAHQMQMEVHKREQQEQENHIAERQKKIVALEATLMNKQMIEMTALRQKLERLAIEHQRMREQEQNKLLQRYQNMRKELDNQQNLEKIRIEKKLNGGSPDKSKMSTLSNSPSKKSFQNSKLSLSGGGRR